MTHNDFVALITPGATINLPAGEIIQTESFISIPSGVTIMSDPTNPAIFRKSDADWMFGIRGESVTFKDVMMDFHMQGLWDEFQVCIGWSAPGGNPAADAPIRDTLLDNITFINSGVETLHPRRGGVDVGQGTGDCWAISLNAHFNIDALPLRNVVVRNCTNLAPTTQLTANGWGAGGIDGLTICGNTVDRGYANAIACTMAGGVARTHKNITITNNTITNALGIGIFVGRDGTDQVLEVALENIIITDNHIDFSTDYPQGTPPIGETPAVFQFPIGIGIRATAGLEATSGIVIARNTIDVSNADDPNDPDYHAPRFYVLSGAGTYSQFGNMLTGTGSISTVGWTEVPYVESGMDTMIAQYYQHT